MIENDVFEEIIFIYDFCGNELKTETNDFYRALDIFKNEKWKSIKENGYW